MILRSIYALVSLAALLSFSVIHSLSAQNSDQEALDSLLRELPKAKSDTNKVNLLNGISWEYKTIDPQKGIEYGLQGFALAEEISWVKGKAITMTNVGINSF